MVSPNSARNRLSLTVVDRTGSSASRQCRPVIFGKLPKICRLRPLECMAADSRRENPRKQLAVGTADRQSSRGCAEAGCGAHASSFLTRKNLEALIYGRQIRVAGASSWQSALPTGSKCVQAQPARPNSHGKLRKKCDIFSAGLWTFGRIFFIIELSAL